MERTVSFDYRDRCCDLLRGERWSEINDVPSAKYDLCGKVLKKRFGHLLPPDKNSSILDVACGVGYFVDFLQKQGYESAIGVDINPKSVELATKAGVKNMEQGDLFDYLPAHLEEFDLIIGSHVVEHFTKSEGMHFLDLIYKSLKPGGRALIRTPNVTSLWGNIRAFVSYEHEVVFTPLMLKELMRVCNFSDVLIRGEEPVIRNFRSAVRVVLWKGLKVIYGVLASVELGTEQDATIKIGRIYTPFMYAIGTKAK